MSPDVPPELPPLPTTIEECQANLKALWFFAHRPRLYIGDDRWNEGYWFYRDRSDGKLFLVCGQLREGLSVVLATTDHLSVVGVTAGPDAKDRPHAPGIEIVTTHDAMGDFMSMAESWQGKQLT